MPINEAGKRADSMHEHKKRASQEGPVRSIHIDLTGDAQPEPDILHVESRSWEVWCWYGSRSSLYISSPVPSVYGHDDYSIILRGDGFINVVGGFVKSWTTNKGDLPVFDVRGEPWEPWPSPAPPRGVLEGDSCLPNG